MNRKLVFSVLGAAALSCAAIEFITTSELPPPDKTGGKPLMQCLTERKSTREFDGTKRLDAQTLSDLLYAAWGVNRPDGKHTAPTAMNRQAVEVFVLLPNGVFHFNPTNHSLEKISEEDARAQAGPQPMHANAAAIVVMVSDDDKQSNAGYAAFEAGCVSQNISLFCASEGLGTVVVARFNREALDKILKLPKTWSIQMVQPVGFPNRNTP
ncbi:MAG: SagB/ThcOx family dehydrogenase [Victivallaceae bacterium]